MFDLSANVYYCSFRIIFWTESNKNDSNTETRPNSPETSFTDCVIKPVTLQIWLTAVLNLLWSAVYQKNCHPVCCNTRIRAAPQLVWKIHTKTHQQQRDKEIVKVLHQDYSKLCFSEDFSLHPSLPTLLGLSHLSAARLPAFHPSSLWKNHPVLIFKTKTEPKWKPKKF